MGQIRTANHNHQRAIRRAVRAAAAAADAPSANPKP